MTTVDLKELRSLANYAAAQSGHAHVDVAASSVISLLDTIDTLQAENARLLAAIENEELTERIYHSSTKKVLADTQSELSALKASMDGKVLCKGEPAGWLSPDFKISKQRGYVYAYPVYSPSEE